MAHGKEANGDKLGIFFDLLYNFIYVFWTYRKNFIGTQKRVRMIHGKRAIGVRVIEVLPYMLSKQETAFRIV